MALEAEKMYLDAVRLLKDGRIGDAADVLLELSGKFPGFAPASSGLGDVFSGHLNDPGRAELYYKTAMAADVSSPGPLTGYAELLIRSERYAEANAHLNKAANMAGAPRDIIHKLFGMLHEAQVHIDEAVESYKKAILATFSDELLDACEKAIARCEAKRRYL